MTIEEIANETTLRTAFCRVAANRGAPGPDLQSIEEVRENLNECLRRLHQSLLDGTYRVGDIRRVWIPKNGGGKRGLGIPNVVDRVVQQAVHQVFSPHYEPSFHRSSHGFRPDRSRRADSSHVPADKVLDRRFNWPRPCQAWSGDITYVWTAEGLAYLAMREPISYRRDRLARDTRFSAHAETP